MKSKLSCLCIALFSAGVLFADVSEKVQGKADAVKPATPTVRVSPESAELMLYGDVTGNFQKGSAAKSRSLLACPDEGTLYDQNLGQSNYTTARTSDTNPGYAVADNFTNVQGPIQDLHFWGLQLACCWSACTESSPRFNVRILGDGGGQPNYGDVVCSWNNVLATRTDTGELFANAYTIWRFDIDPLPSDCGPLNPDATYWLEIVGTGGQADCWFLWIDSDLGDLMAYQQGASPPVVETDQAFCITGDTTAVGACCDDSTGTCEDNVSLIDCLGAFQRWVENAACADLNPVCGEALGACCYDDGTCALTTYSDCEGGQQGCPGDMDCDGDVDFDDIAPFVAAIGADPETWEAQYNCIWLNGDMDNDGDVDFDDIAPFVGAIGTTCFGGKATGPRWLGPDTICDDCCTVVCDGIAEGEPLCEQDYEDVFNGGCNSVPPIWSPIACGDVVCGESGTFLVEDPENPGQFFQSRDTDWYSVTVADPTIFTWTVEAEFPVQILTILAGDCAEETYVILDSATAPACTPVSLTTSCLEPGEYWFWVGPSVFDGVRCGMDYQAVLTCEGCELCIVECPPDAVIEEEPCGEHLNDGCELGEDPSFWVPVECDVDYCGTVFASNGDHDEDYYELVLDFPTNVVVGWDGEYPARVGFWGGENGFTDPTCEDGWHWGAFFDECDSSTGVNMGLLNPGYYWFDPVPWTEAGGVYNDGYPCEKNYTFNIQCEVIDCSGVCDVPPPGTNTDEGEPDCGEGYVDLTNAGCDGDGTLFLPITWNDAPQSGDNAQYCGNSGHWSDGEDTDWYEFTVPAGETYQWTVDVLAEFELTWEIYDASLGCGAAPVEGHTITPCLFSPVRTFCYAEGTYWLRVSSQFGTPCGKQYVLWFHELNQGCTPCTIDCPVGSVDEAEPCGDDTNGGCNMATPAFEGISCGDTICGTVWAQDGTRDTDWFTVTTTVATEFTITFDTEVPLGAFVVTGTEEGNPSCSDLLGYLITDIGTCSGGDELTLPILAAGEYWFIVYPEEGEGNPIFDYYPCGTRNTYYMTLDCN